MVTMCFVVQSISLCLALLHACVLDSWSSFSVFDHAVSHVDCCCGYMHLLSAVCVASLVSTADSFHCCLTADVQYNLDGVSRLEGIMGCFNALGTIAFAYGGHNVVLEIQVSLSDKHHATLHLVSSSSAKTTIHMHQPLQQSVENVSQSVTIHKQALESVSTTQELCIDLSGKQPQSCRHA